MDEETFSIAVKAMAEPKRIEILETIRRLDPSNGVPCSCVLSEMTVSQSTFSHHIAELARAGFITERKEGRYSMLSVDEVAVSNYLEHLKTKILG